jgi:hypothetical protein
LRFSYVTVFVDNYLIEIFQDKEEGGRKAISMITIQINKRKKR